MAHANAGDGIDGESRAQPGDQERGGCARPVGEGSGRPGCGVVGYRRPTERAQHDHQRASHDHERERPGEPAGVLPGEPTLAAEETGAPADGGQVWSATCHPVRHGWAYRHGGVRPRQRTARLERPPRRWC